LDGDSRDGFAESVKSVGGWRSRSGGIAGNVPSGLRECPRCVESDTKSFGVAYWHREHQIRGVSRCWRHDVVLREHRWLPGTGFPPELPGFGRYVGCAITEDVRGSSSALKDLWLAKAFASILDSEEPISHADIRRHLMEPAVQLGVCSRGLPRIERAFALVQDAYGGDYLSRLDLPVSYTKHSGMRYSRALSKSPVDRDPLATLLLAGALSVPHDLLSRRSWVGSPLEEVGLVAADATSSSEAVTLQKVLAECGYVLGRSAVALGLTRGELIKAITRSGIQCPIVVGPNAKFDESTIRSMISDMKSGVAWSELSAKFDCSDDILQALPIYDPSLRAAARSSRNQSRIEKHRKVVMRAVESGRTRSDIRNSYPTELSYLRRHDQGWLGEHLALVTRRVASRPAKGTGRGQGPGDFSEDTRILALLESALQSARSLVPPRRVTRSLLIRMGGLKSSLFSKLRKGRYLKVDAFLAASEEPYEDFIGRRLTFAFRRLEEVSPVRPITLARLRLASGLSEKVLVSRRALIEEMVRASTLAISPWAVPWLREARLTGLSA